MSSPHQQLLPNVYSLGYKAGQTISGFFSQSAEAATTLHYPSSIYEIFNAITSFPGLYKEWWLSLVINDPIHVFVETTLIVSIVYILITGRRHKDWKARESKLTPAEEQELLMEWKLTKAPIVPVETYSYEDGDNDDNDELGEYDDLQQEIVVHKVQGRTMEIEIVDNSSNNNNGSAAGAAVDGGVGGGCGGGGSGELQTVLNMSTFDFLGMSSNESEVKDVKDAALAALNKYGCGSCGPRGFYGTVDVHLQLEQKMSQFCRTEGAILYSDGASMCSSTVASFAKRGDLIVADEGIYEPLKTGIALSRAHVKWFQHNDMNDLQRVLQSIQNKDKQLGRKSNQQRRFIVVEGLYKNSGTICPLDRLVKLKHEFCYRLILDESYSFGTLGPTGRGVVELFGLKHMQDAEIVTIGLENAMGSIGGLTIGTDEVVDHQRLSGSGYCFSASSPPFTATAAMASLNLLDTQPKLFLQRLIDNRVYLYEKLKSWCINDKVNGTLIVTSDDLSPIVMFQVANVPETEYLDRYVFFAEVVRESLLSGGVAFVATAAGGQRPSRGGDPHHHHQTAQQQATTTASPVDNANASNSEQQQIQQHQQQQQQSPPPGLRMVVSAALTHADIDHALSVLAESVYIVMERFREESK